MQSDSNLNEQGSNDNRRKRVNRMKKLIVVGAILLILLPTICCIILGIQLYRIQKQVDKISVLYGMSQSTEETKNGLYAYAAEKSNTSLDNVPTVTPSLESNTDLEASDHKSENSDTHNNVLPAKITDNSDEQNKDTIGQNVTDPSSTDKTSSNGNDISSDIDKNSKNDKDKDISKGIYAGKKVYLTFDDGPSEYTDLILDTLKEYHVKATFFVIGKTDDKSKALYKRIVKEGHTLGMHSYSHKYDKIYNSVEDFDKDFTKLWKLLYDTTGYKPSIYRFPGGSDNLVNHHGMDEFIQYLNDKSIVYFDWNVINGDATNITYTKQQLVDNVLDGIANKDRSIVLMHDAPTKKSTADSLPKLIKALVSGGAQILPLDNKIAPIQMIKADSVK